MQEIEQMRVQRERVFQDLIKAQQATALHLKANHGGWIASTCHECYKLKFSMETLEWVLNEIDGKLANITDYYTLDS